MTTAMLVAFGENDIKTVEDLAGCATDDLVGWVERKDERGDPPRRHPRRLRPIARKEAEEMIMAARVKAGWIAEADLTPPEPPAEASRRRDGAETAPTTAPQG